ncbi:MAG: hypothetical protein ACYDCG_01105 [Candidatus Acidiferrales bacterium]
MKKTYLTVILLAFVSTAFSLAAQSQSPREAFKQALAELQQNPADDTLRGKLIQSAANLDPVPAVPEDARRFLIEGMTLHQEAKTPEDEQAALDSFAKALQSAPWWGDIYLGQSVSQELTGQFEAAEKSLRFYLLSNPGEEKSRSAQDHIYVLEAKLRKAHAAVQASQQQIEQRKNLTGWWQCKTGCDGYKWLQSDGSDIKAQIDWWSFEGHFEQDAISGLASLPAQRDASNVSCTFPEQKHRMTAFVEDGGAVLRLKFEYTTYQSKSHSQPDVLLGYLSPTQVCDSVTPVNTSPQEIVLAGGAKQSNFGVAITTITPAMKDLPTDKQTTNAVKDGYNYCRKSQKLDAAGVLVSSVEPDSAAAAGGLKPGDIIHLQSRSNSRGATLFCTAEELSNFLHTIPPGNTFALEVFDGSKRAQLYNFSMGVRGQAVQASLNTSNSGGRRFRHKK